MAADVDQQVLITAFVRRGHTEVAAMHAQAMADTLSGVQVTSVTFEGASGSGTASEVNTAKLLVILEQALQILECDTANDRVVHASFNGGFLQT